MNKKYLLFSLLFSSFSTQTMERILQVIEKESQTLVPKVTRICSQNLQNLYTTNYISPNTMNVNNFLIQTDSIINDTNNYILDAAKTNALPIAVISIAGAGYTIWRCKGSEFLKWLQEQNKHGGGAVLVAYGLQAAERLGVACVLTYFSQKPILKGLYFLTTTSKCIYKNPRAAIALSLVSAGSIAGYGLWRNYLDLKNHHKETNEDIFDILGYHSADDSDISYSEWASSDEESMLEENAMRLVINTDSESQNSDSANIDKTSNLGKIEPFLPFILSISIAGLKYYFNINQSHADIMDMINARI